MGNNGGQKRVCGTSGRHWGAVLCPLLLSGLLPVTGQDFVLTLAKTPDPIIVGSNINYSLSVSNATGSNLNPGVISSEYGSLAEFVQATSDFSYTTSVGRVDFAIPAGSLPIDGVIQVALELRGTNVGLLTNIFTVVINDGGQTEPASTNVVSSIEPPPTADLGISIVGPSDGVFVDDSFHYQLLATNAGPSSASGVVVSNQFPSNVSLIGFSPSNRVEVANGWVLFSVGTLTNQESATATVSVVATNANATNLIWATIRAPTITDTNPANDSFTSNVPILTPVLGQIVVTNVFAQEFNQQTGWMEQRVQLINVSNSAVDSVRLLVGGLTNRLVNAMGTNGTTPYVTHGATLAPGEGLELVLEYANPTRTAGANPVLTAYGTPALDLSPAQGDGITVDRIVQMTGTNLNQGRILLEWPVVTGATYQVIYYEPDLASTNAKGSMPLVNVPSSANRVQWLDYGPPRTLARPTNSAARFYKVIQLP